MERVHYRRRTPPKFSQSSAFPEGRERRKTFHEQDVSPKFAAPPTHEVAEEPEKEEGFKEKLIAQGIISGIILMVVLILRLTDHAQVVDIRASLSNALSGHVTTEQVADEVRRLLAIGEETFMGTGTPVQEVFEQPPATTRIDENLLRELSEGTDDLQTTAPEPIATPEL